MKSRSPTTIDTFRSPVWPVLATVLLVVLAPTACMLWFLTAAMRNEHLAARQRLMDVHRGQATAAREALGQYWSDRLASLEAPADRPAPRRFRALIAAGAFDAVVVCDERGRPAYPPTEAPGPIEASKNDDEWRTAEEAEFGRDDPNAAAQVYAQIAARAEDPSRQARALRDRARCLAKVGRKDQAIALLAEMVEAEAYGGAADARGRLIAPDAAALALRLIGDPNAPPFRRLAAALRERLDDYDGAEMPASQRLFLMGELRRHSGAEAWPAYEAERLAAEYLDGPQQPAEVGRWSRSDTPGVWHIASPSGQAIGLCRRQRLIEDSRQACAAGANLTGIRILVVPPESDTGTSQAFLTLASPGPLAGWRMEVHLLGEDPFAAAAGRQNAVYLWTAGLGVTVIVTLAAVLAGWLSRQMKLARLKNDLIATVSHELKTPLASIRVLIDTLLAGRCRDEQQAREYYGLIARENRRLSRVIENFLTFSRMQRNKIALNVEALNVEELVGEAVDAMAERFERLGCRPAVELPADLPAVRGDRDALVTVLINLLDNACKYTGDDKSIAVRAAASGGQVCLSVTDNGVGLTGRAARRVFDRFYQADPRLSRGAGGCGLGLDIVKFLVEAHGGAVDVASRPGEGSTFTVRLPAEAGHGQVTNDE